MKYIILNEMTVNARPGADVSDCIEEAIIYAIQQRVNVVLVHNTKEYVISPIKLMETVERR